ncbi:MAG: glycoside hydrolase family 24 [Hyphomicrobiales bacterium]|nr:MAG: glycoside hydrolase family 24 [Hyphomicrobiales bacterium]
MTDTGFHEVRFPTDIARGAIGGPLRNTQIVALASGHEQRNTRWAHSRRKYNVGYGMKTLDDLYQVISFFEQRRGKLYGFRFRDAFDFKSCSPGDTISAQDQDIGTGDGTATSFALRKTYGTGISAYVRIIGKPVAGTVEIEVGGAPQVLDTDFTLDPTSGAIEFLPGSIPPDGETISAGFEFDVAVRFDVDEITVNLRAFQAGDIPSIPLVEVLL